MAQGSRVLLLARGFMGRELRKTGDALRLLVVRFGEPANLGFQSAEQLEQLAFAFLADGLRLADFFLDFVQIAFIHVANVFVAGNSASLFTNARRAAGWAAPVPRFLH